MSYVTQQDLIDRFGEGEILDLSDRNNDGAIDADVLERAIADAASEIDGYLAKRYQLPLASIPQRLVRVGADLARLFLHTDSPPDAVVAAAAQSRAWLRDVANGVVELGVTPPPVASADGAKVEGPARMFSSGSLKGL